MKKYMAIFLIFSLLLNITGCYSFRQIYYDENTDITDIESNDVRVTLTNGTKIRSDAYHHTLIYTNSEFIVGVVNRYLQGYNYSEPFNGRIMKSDIDSSYLDPQNGNYTVWLKSKKSITFPAGHYFIVTNETEKGFWYWKNDITQRIDLNEILSIEVDRINVLNTILFAAAGVSVFLFLLAWLVSTNMEMDINLGNFN